MNRLRFLNAPPVVQSKQLAGRATRIFRLILLTLIIFAGGAVARAHSVWIEDTPGGGLVLRFGEIGEEVEKSPGYLDHLTAITAWTKEGEGKLLAIDIQKQADGFVLVEAASAKPAQADTGYEVMKSRSGPARRPCFYARWQPLNAGAGTPQAILDLVPTGKSGEIRVYFRGQPLPDVELELHEPDGTTKDLTADKLGLVHFTTAKSGLYRLTYSHHRESIDGFHGGHAYGLVSHNACLSWRQP